MSKQEEPDKKIIEELILLLNQKKYSEALNLASKILDNFPKSILVNNIAGVIQTELHNYNLAKKLFIKVVSLNPKYIDGNYNLANIYNKLGKEDKAIEIYEKVIELDKHYYKAYNNLGNIFRKKNLNKKALEYYILALKINPNYKRVFYNLASLLQNFIYDEKNKYINNFFLHLLENKTIVRPNAIATNIINGLFLNSNLRDNFSLIENNKYPKNIDRIIQELSKNTLLLQFMKVCPIQNYYFEKNFIKIRNEVLNNIFNLNYNQNNLKFLISLSTQCFLNEYVYSETNEEINKLKEIEKRLKKKIKNQEINDLEVLILSCYSPLHKYEWCRNVYPSNNLSETFKLQIINYNEEKKESLKINSISNVNNSISIKVKKQYEKYPYPRWTNLGLSIEPKHIKDVFKYKNLDIDFQKINFSEKIEILISGCGTGQHALTTASVYKNANVYALDLSLNSLSYAKRKAKELGFENINFIQGDLLDIKKLNKKFDLIESVGVLHHMSDPFLGWKILTDCLKDNSFMWIGLYSKKAREHIAEIRKSIKELKIETTKYNIDSFRKKIFNDNSTKWNSLKNSPDFYSTSGIVDLLFHVQEHNFTIPIIREYMKTLNLFFLGFEDANIINKFKKIYNKPRDVYDLDKWHKFEIKNPKVFSGMYQFWCQK